MKTYDIGESPEVGEVAPRRVSHDGVIGGAYVIGWARRNIGKGNRGPWTFGGCVAAVVRSTNGQGLTCWLITTKPLPDNVVMFAKCAHPAPPPVCTELSSMQWEITGRDLIEVMYVQR